MTLDQFLTEASERSSAPDVLDLPLVAEDSQGKRYFVVGTEVDEHPETGDKRILVRIVEPDEVGL